MAHFDEHAEAYDSWFFDNENLLISELKLVAHFLLGSKETLSIGCGSGLFEMLLKRDFGITVKYGVEPSEGMAKIARKRGMDVTVATAEAHDIEPGVYDTIMFNGSPSYITDLNLCIQKAYGALKPDGKIIVIDVPKESGYATLYNLAKSLGTWDDDMLDRISPANPYPIELVKLANWRTTEEKVALMEANGFESFEYAQTLVTHPVFSSNEVQDVIEGYDRGDYVAICAYKRA